jgi:hypothetical protein
LKKNRSFHALSKTEAFLALAARVCNSNAAWVFTVSPRTSAAFIYLGGLRLTDGASPSMASRPGGRTQQDYYALVLGLKTGTIVPALTLEQQN